MGQAKKGLGITRVGRYLILLFVLGVVTIAVSHTHGLHNTLTAEVLRDLGIALCIAVVIARLIELSLSRKTFLNGLDAIMNRTVPENVWQEFRQHVVTATMIRKNFTVAMVIDSRKNGICVSRTKVSYSVVALVDGLRDSITHEVDRHRAPPSGGPRFLSVGVSGKTYNGFDAIKAAGLISADGHSLILPVALTWHNDVTAISYEFLETITCPDAVVWWLSAATQDVTVSIEGLPEDWNALLTTSHPSGHQPSPKSASTWKFTGTMLPGQGVELQIRRQGESGLGDQNA